jgi:L-ribulose-5-phosphate 3-epimerase
MKIGVTQIILGKWSLEEALKLCQEAGYDALELVFGEGQDPDIDMSDDEIRGVGDRCDGAGVQIGSLVAWYGERGCYLTTDDGQRQAARRCLHRSIDIAHLLGVDAVLLHPGQLSSDATYEAIWNLFVEEMKETGGYAAAKGVTVGIENVWNKFLLSPREMAEFIDAVGSDRVGAYLDTANMMAYGYPEHWIRGLGKRISRVHFKDFSRPNHSFVDLMDGDTDWPVVMSELRAVGYDRPLIHEVGGDRQALIETAERMRKIVRM